jgi:hypothetical protein
MEGDLFDDTSAATPVVSCGRAMHLVLHRLLIGTLTGEEI